VEAKVEKKFEFADLKSAEDFEILKEAGYVYYDIQAGRLSGGDSRREGSFPSLVRAWGNLFKGNRRRQGDYFLIDFSLQGEVEGLSAEERESCSTSFAAYMAAKEVETAQLEAEAEREERRRRKAFAAARFRVLLEAGLSRKTASAVMRAAGPGRALEALRWARYAQAELGEHAFLILIRGVNAGVGFGKVRVEKAISRFGIEPPSACNSKSLFAILAAAQVIA